jgi:hypothetical protein
LLPDNLEAWAYLLLTCLIGFVIGKWISARRNKGNAAEEAASHLKREIKYTDKLAKKGKPKKRNRKINL